MLEKLLLEIFGGNPYHARAKKKQGGGIYYTLESDPITIPMMKEHLGGKDTLGSYPLLQDNTVKWIAWDIDSPDDLLTARKIAQQIISRISHLPYAVEFSGNKGYHVFLFLDKPVPATLAKTIAEWVRDKEHLAKSGNPHVECYPKQAFLGNSTDSRKAVGNMLKIPLGLHPYTHNRSVFVDPENGWEEGPPLAPEEVLSYRITYDELTGIKDEGQGTFDLLVKAVASEWVENKRHDISLYLAGFLCQLGWTSEQTVELVREVCKITHDPETRNREQSVRDTYRKVAQGKVVAGFQRLSEMISGSAMKIITEEAPNMMCPIHAIRVDNIRMEKGPIYKKVAKVMITIWGWLTDREEGGRILRVKADQYGTVWKTYWFNTATKLMTDMESTAFKDVLYKNFHLNEADNFVQNVTTLLIQRARVMGDDIEVHKRSFMKDGKLYVNLGGIEVYVLDGSPNPTVQMNGDDDIFFLAHNPYAPRPDFEHPVDVWKELIDPINFAASDDVSMTPEQQGALLKAWILAFFFRDSLPHRPILTMLGDPGSGKTTAIRQILRLIEGLDRNVAGLAEDKQDAWRAMIEHDSMIVLDNLEDTKAQWIPNQLDRISTGQEIELRVLYRTNEIYKIKPDVFVAITAVSVPFSKATVFERMLILNMKKLTTYTPAHVIENRLRDNIDGLWADLLYKLNKVVPYVDKEVVLAQQARMADFAMFCARIRDSEVIDRESLTQAIRQLGTAQQQALAASDNSAFQYIQEFVEKYPQKAATTMTVGTLYEEIKTIAGRSLYWTSSRKFTTHIKAISKILEAELGANLRQLKIDSSGKPSQFGKDTWCISFGIFGENGNEDVVVDSGEDDELYIDLERQPGK
jgi:hypothetical protein